MEFKCNICHETELIRSGVTTISTLNCGHVFHMLCVRRWFEIKKECPQCRRLVRYIDLPMTKLQLLIEERSEPRNTSIDQIPSIRMYRGKLASLGILYHREERTLSLLQDRAKAMEQRLVLAQAHSMVLQRSLTLLRARVASMLADSEFIQGTVTEEEAVVPEERLTVSYLIGLLVRYKNENRSIEEMIKQKSESLRKEEVERRKMKNELKRMKSEVARYKLINKTNK